MPRTAAILTSHPPTIPGGVEHVVRELVKGLELRGYEVLVLHRDNAAPRWLRHPEGHLAKVFGDFLLSWYLGRKLRESGARDLVAVITNGAFGWYIPGLNRNSCSRVHIYHGTYRAQAEAIRPFISWKGYLKLKWWDSMVLERACGAGKQVVCNSDQTRDEVRCYFGHEGVTTWLPLDTSHFRPLDQSECRRSLALSEHEPVGLFVGSAHPMKGFPMIQKLMESLCNVRWLLCLRGRMSTGLPGNAKVNLFQDTPYDLLPTLYGAANFLVMPSLYEPFGYVAAESLACGTPVITTPTGASRLLLSRPPLDSLVVPSPSGLEQFLAAIRRVIEDPESFRQLVIQSVRPQIQMVMAPENWWPHFLTVAGL